MLETLGKENKNANCKQLSISFASSCDPARNAQFCIEKESPSHEVTTSQGEATGDYRTGHWAREATQGREGGQPTNEPKIQYHVRGDAKAEPKQHNRPLLIISPTTLAPPRDRRWNPRSSRLANNNTVQTGRFVIKT